MFLYRTNGTTTLSGFYWNTLFPFAAANKTAAIRKSRRHVMWYWELFCGWLDCLIIFILCVCLFSCAFPECNLLNFPRGVISWPRGFRGSGLVSYSTVYLFSCLFLIQRRKDRGRLPAVAQRRGYDVSNQRSGPRQPNWICFSFWGRFLETEAAALCRQVMVDVVDDFSA